MQCPWYLNLAEGFQKFQPEQTDRHTYMIEIITYMHTHMVITLLAAHLNMHLSVMKRLFNAYL